MNYGMIIGQIDKDDEIVKFDMDLRCTNCKRRVPGGMKTSKKYYQTEQFKTELKIFEERYLCGICRDKERVRERIK